MKKHSGLFRKSRQILNLVFLGLIIVFFVALFMFKGKLNNAASTIVLSQATPETISTVAAYIDSVYNYEENSQLYEITFLEFGSTGCSACKRMEKVLQDIKDLYPTKVNVVFINATMKENHDLLRFYGIAVIPTQVLLDKTGREFFRHTGFISSDELRMHLE
ncbi:MAG: thioredoxin family protein [Bacteroidales bacterium]|nr:thioredoxin family protein [Bacteroidales bacterium]